MNLGIVKLTSKRYDDSIFSYMVENIKDYFDQVLILSDGEKAEEKHSVLEFENVFFESTLLKKKILQYDTITIFTDKLVGPFNSIKNVIEKVRNAKSAVILSLYNVPDYKRNDNTFVLHHPDVNFMCINRSVLNSDVFISKFDDFFSLDESKVIGAVLEFGKKNICCKSIVKTDCYVSKSVYDNVELSLFSYEMLKYDRIPFILWNVFEPNHYLTGGDEAPIRTFNWIKNNSQFNEDLIWERLLNNYGLTQIKQMLHLEKVFSENREKEELVLKNKKKIAVLAHLYYEDALKECFSYLLDLSKNIDIYILTANANLESLAEKKILDEHATNISILRKENRGRDFSALLVAGHNICQTHDYICFIHDKKSHDGSPITSGKTWMYTMWSSLLKSKEYVNNLLERMDKEEKLGLLVPPEPFHSEAIGGLGNTWAQDFDGTKMLLEKMGITDVLSKNDPPITLGTAFWCKREALAPLLDYPFTYEDFPEEPMENDGTICHALERALTFVAKSQGFYTCYALSEELAALRASKLSRYLVSAIAPLRDNGYTEMQNGGVVFNYNNTLEGKCSYKKVENYLRNHKRVYIYGAGKFGKICRHILANMDTQFEGYIVSNIDENNELLDEPVLEYNGQIPGNCGLIVALGKKNASEVIPLLLQDGIVDFIAFI